MYREDRTSKLVICQGMSRVRYFALPLYSRMRREYFNHHIGFRIENFYFRPGKVLRNSLNLLINIPHEPCER